MLINLIIIYLACGSPIGVYRITRVAKFRASRVAALGAYFVFWPIFIPAIVRRSASSDNLSTDIDVERKLDAIRLKMDAALIAADDNFPRLEFRDVFARFAGLSIALNSSGHASAELFTISDHKTPALGLACVNRRNRKRLAFHQLRASRDFVEAVSENDILRKLGLQAARLLGDQKTFNDILALNGDNSVIFESNLVDE